MGARTHGRWDERRRCVGRAGVIMVSRHTRIAVALDAGHGGEDYGAVWGGMREKDIALDVSCIVHSSVAWPGWRIDSSMVRSADAGISQRTRGGITTAAGVDIVVHVHVDSRPGSGLAGMRAYHWPGNELGEHVAQSILMAAPSPLRSGVAPIAAVGPPAVPQSDWRRGAREVMRWHRATSVLVELGYLSSECDRRALADSCIRVGAAGAILVGLLEGRRRLLA